MKVPRFYLTDEHGLILETPIALSPIQRLAVRNYAIQEYKRRIKTISKPTVKEQMANIISLLESNKFLERPIPSHDCDRESILFGT